MKRIKVINYHGDGIAKTLRKLRDFYGDKWTRSMARYAISKIRKLPVTYDIIIKKAKKS